MQMMQHPYIGNITSVDTGWIIRVDKPETFAGKNSYTWGHVMQGPVAADDATKNQILADIHDLDSFADFGVPTREKLERQFQLAQAVMENCHRATGYAPEQVNCNLQLVIPPIVEQVHGQAAAASVPGMAGSAPPQMTAPAGMPSAGVAPAPQPAGVPAAPASAPAPAVMPTAPAPAPQLLTTPPPGAEGPPGQFPGMGAAMPPQAPVAPPSAMPPAPAAMPAAPAATPPAPAPMPAAVPGASPQAQVPLPGAGPVAMPQAPGPAPMPPAPAPMPPAPAAMPPAPGNQQPPFPPAPAPQPEAPTADGAGETKAEKPKAGKVRCPGCGKDYSGKRGLSMHLRKSEACRAAADQPPVSVEEAMQTQQSAEAAPPGMAPPNWTGEQPGPFPQT
jgi:hypothetical protein